MKDGLSGERLETCSGGSSIDNPRESRVENDQRKGQWGCKVPSTVQYSAFVYLSLYSQPVSGSEIVVGK